MSVVNYAEEACRPTAFPHAATGYELLETAPKHLQSLGPQATLTQDMARFHLSRDRWQCAGNSDYAGGLNSANKPDNAPGNPAAAALR